MEEGTTVLQTCSKKAEDSTRELLDVLRAAVVLPCINECDAEDVKKGKRGDSACMVYVCICVCVYICVHLCMCTFVYVYICVCVHLCMCTFVYVYICVCVHLCMCTFVYVCICV